MTENWYIKIKISGDIDFVQCDDLDDYYREIDCDTVQMVTPHDSKRKDLVMILDDNGKLVGKDVNMIASGLYALDYDLIVGDVLIGRVNDVGDDVIGFDRDRLDSLLDQLFNIAMANIYRKLGR